MKILGTVLNKYDPDREGYYGYYGSYYSGSGYTHTYYGSKDT